MEVEEQNRKRRGERHSRRRRRRWFSWETKERERREISSREEVMSLKALFSSLDKTSATRSAQRDFFLLWLPPTFVEFMIPCLVLHIYKYSEEESINILNNFILKRMTMKNIYKILL